MTPFGWPRRDGGGSDGGSDSGDGTEAGDPGQSGDHRVARERLVERLAPRLSRESTAEALRAVPRHEFVPEGRRGAAYADRPLPIGRGQTISAPHMVAEMVDRLGLDPGERVLEIGTGCGYHAAVTAAVVGPEHVYSVEYHDDLASAARDRLGRLGYGDVSIRVGDGHAGWPDHAPYDAAYLTCAAPSIPEAVVSQVRDSGRVLAPIGGRTQHLVLARKVDGGLDRQPLGAVRFVPMQGDG